MQEVIWQDGYKPNGLPMLPESLRQTIQRNLVEFERKVTATAWYHKTCDHDKGNKAIHILHRSAEADHVPVARYLYGRKRQFLVVWLPDQTAPDSRRPHAAKFDTLAQNSNPFSRDGWFWRPSPYTTWAPSHEYVERTIWRLVAAKQVNPPKREPAPRPKISFKINESGAYEVVDDSPAGDSPPNARKRPLEDEQDLTGQGSHAPIDLTSDTNYSEAIHHTQHADIEHGLKGEGASASDMTSPARRVSTRLPESVKADRRALYAVKRGNYPISAPLQSSAEKQTITVEKRDIKKQKPSIVEDFSKVLVICRDAQDKIKGTFPYDECDTAQKLFDVVCVSEIARIEPPATRLLKVSFGNGREGRIRPDNITDFENVVSSPLREILRTTKKGIAITITPYL